MYIMLKLYKDFNKIEVGLYGYTSGVMFGRLYALAVIMLKLINLYIIKNNLYLK